MINKVSFQHQDLSIHEADLFYDRPGMNECIVQLTHDLIGVLSKTSTDYFSALIEIIRLLDEQGIKLLCWGARPDVLPTGFQADCTKGMIATRLFLQPPLASSVGTKIKQARNIFSPALPEEVGTVADRIEFINLRKQRCNMKQCCIGLDGCKGGWMGVSRNPNSGDLEARLFESFEHLKGFSYDVIAIDIPIGLPDKGNRRCDLAARQMIRPRGCCVFPAPLRSILQARTYQEACNIREKVEGLRISQQTYFIMPKIHEVDQVLQDSREFRKRVYEIHPEVSFCCMNGGQPLTNAKRSAAGRQDRINLVEGHFGAMTYEKLKGTLHKNGMWAADDLLDACAALWSAERIAASSSFVALPDNETDFDSTGLPMRICY